jgi:hypothetical protein
LGLIFDVFAALRCESWVDDSSILVRDRQVLVRGDCDLDQAFPATPAEMSDSLAPARRGTVEKAHKLYMPSVPC